MFVKERTFFCICYEMFRVEKAGLACAIIGFELTSGMKTIQMGNFHLHSSCGDVSQCASACIQMGSVIDQKSRCGNYSIYGVRPVEAVMPQRNTVALRVSRGQPWPAKMPNVTWHVAFGSPIRREEAGLGQADCG